MEKNMDKDYLRSVVIPGLMKDGISLEQVSAELNYRDVAGVVDSHGGWDDDLIDYSTKELESIEAVWSEGSITLNQVQEDGFAVGLARQLRDLMGDLIENNEGYWEDLSIRLPIVIDGLDGYGMVIRAVEEDARDQFFLVSVYEGFSEEDLGDEFLHECTETDDLDEMEAVTRGLLEQVCTVRDILRLAKSRSEAPVARMHSAAALVADVREQIEKNDEASVQLENGRTVDVTLAYEELDEDEQFFVVELWCNEKEMQNHDYNKTNGVIDSYSCSGKDLNEVEKQVKRALRCNERYPVAHYNVQPSLDSMIDQAENSRAESENSDRNVDKDFSR